MQDQSVASAGNGSWAQVVSPGGSREQVSIKDVEAVAVSGTVSGSSDD